MCRRTPGSPGTPGTFEQQDTLDRARIEKNGHEDNHCEGLRIKAPRQRSDPAKAGGDLGAEEGNPLGRGRSQERPVEVERAKLEEVAADIQDCRPCGPLSRAAQGRRSNPCRFSNARAGQGTPTEPAGTTRFRWCPLPGSESRTRTKGGCAWQSRYWAAIRRSKRNGNRKWAATKTAKGATRAASSRQSRRRVAK